MKVSASAALLLLAAVAAAAEMTSLEGYQVLRVEYSAAKESWIREEVRALGLDVWADSSRGMDVMVPSDKSQALLDTLTSRGVRTSVFIEDVQKLIDQQFDSISKHTPSSEGAMDHTTYRSFGQLQVEIDLLEQAYPALVTSEVVSQTHEGRALRVVTVSSGGASSRPVVWIDCGIHAREWVSQATCMYILDQFTSLYGTDATITGILDSYDIMVLPVTNPDGYAYTWESERLWRKNRVPYGLCYGADPNRNFDSFFGGPGASDAPCSDTYHGPSAFSEFESSAVRDATTAVSGRLAAFFTIHSYSQYWMTPYGSKASLPADYTEMMRVSEIGVTALTAVHGTPFVYGNIADVIYLASGGSTDWAYDALGVIYPFALELRDQGRYGFLLPEEQIVPTGEETIAGIIAAVEAMPL